MPEKRRTRKAESVRQRATKNDATRKPRRIKSTVKKAGKPFALASQLGNKEINIPLPDNKIGRFLGKKQRIIPRFFRESFDEIKQVSWPNRKETIKSTIAVFIFALVFGTLIWITDYGLEKLFRKVLLK